MRTGLLVRIYVSDKIQLESKGVVYEILSKCDDHKGIIVLLDNGDSGHVVEIFPSSSVEIMIERIMDTESHVSENKLNFYEPVMMNKVIPLTVQSFLNSDGGYLYIGIFDPGVTVNEKIVGLKEDRDMVREKLIKLKKIEPEQELSDTEFKDKLVSDMEQILGKFIVSDTPLGPLLDFKFPTINGVMILELNIKRSSMPFFYKHKDKKSKEI